MQWADRIRTKTMAALLRVFEDTVYDASAGTVLMTPDELAIERQIAEEDGEQWIYTTTIGVTVERRRLH